MWMELAQNQNNDVSTLLSASGTDQTDKLANPVYLETENTVLIWVATLDRNQGAFKDGKRVCPDILNPGFDTNYINCRDYPYTIKQSEIEMYGGGVYKEGDQLEVTSFPSPQVNSVGDQIPVAGFAKKVTLASRHSFLLPDEDLLVPGT